MKTIIQIKSLVLLSFFSLLFYSAFSQSSYWTRLDESSIAGSGKRYLTAENAVFLDINFESLKSQLAKSPFEREDDVRKYGQTIQVPMPDGSIQSFSIASYNLMERALANKYPEIRTFLGSGITDPSSQIFIDFTLQGFHAQILSEKGSVYIDPVFQNETRFYMCYERKNLRKLEKGIFNCGISEKEFEKGEIDKSNGSNPPNSALTVSGTTRRTYRLAMATTAEYSIFHGGTVPLVLSAITTTMNRVNGIYNKDVTLRFSLIANTNLLISLTNPDSYSNGDAFTMMGENQSNVDAIIGNANYDIGHVFGTNSGGVVSGRVCTSGNKARGVTGSGAPIGDPFDIDYVAHEIGHQCSAAHTWNGTQSSCSPGQYIAASAVEPGSGITIMAYAGICGSDDLAPNSIDHFHNKSQQEIIAFSQTGSGNTCGTTNATGNTPPTVSVVFPSGVTIPQSTPYELRGSGADVNGDAITFCWEQMNVGTSGPPNVASRVNGPITRSFSPSATGNIRTVPQLSDLLANTSTIGNLLGTATRAMNFNLTVRDNRANGGGMRDASMAFNVTSTAGPFLVTAPNIYLIYGKNQPLTVTWSVANTNVAPVNCTAVAIKLSTDGGLTYPTTLSANTSNDGSEVVTLPNVTSATCRIRVEALNNFFFDISNQNFEIRDYCNANAICNDVDFGQHFISRVRLNTLDRSSSCSPNGFSFTSAATATTTLNTGQAYLLQVNLGTNVANNGVAAWIDYNNDNDFDDFGEMVMSVGPGTGLRTANITIPGFSNYLGARRLRIRSGFNTTFTNTQACTILGFGETEDYVVNITGYCFQTALCQDVDFGSHFISRVNLHTLNNLSSCSPNGYINYTGSVAAPMLKAGQTYPLNVTTSNTSTQGIGVWIDYNNDLDFDDFNEFVYQGLPAASGIFTGNIRIQGLSTYFGIRRMRVRTSFNKTFGATQACSPDGFGETEDYQINIGGYCFPTATCADIEFGNHYINNFNFAGIANSNSNCGNSGYTLYPESQFLGQVGSGLAYTGTALISGGSIAGQAIWIDYNNDEDFNDPGEFVTSRAPTNTALWSFGFTIPSDPSFLGIRRMRIRSSFNTTFGASDACSLNSFGETEDYFINISLGVALGVVQNSQCQGTTIVVPFTTTGAFNGLNIFSVEISDASGSFPLTPNIIGSGSSSPIFCTIPPGITPGNNYKIRIVSSNPAGYSSTSGFIGIFANPVILTMNPTSGPVGTVVTFTGQLSGVQTLQFGQITATPTSISPGGTSLTVTVPPFANTAPVFVSTTNCTAIGPEFTVTGCNLDIATSSIQKTSSPGCNDGQITVGATGTFSGQGKVSLAKFPGPVLISTKNLDGSNAVQFSNLSTGIYWAILFDASNCADTITLELTSFPCSLDVANPVTTPTVTTTGTISYDVLGNNCSGSSTILKKLTGTQFLVQPGAVPVALGGNTFQFQNLGQGTYQVVVASASRICADSVNATITPPTTQVATPTISPVTGSYVAPVTVTITCPTPEAQIYYTVSGNLPVIGTGFTRLYTGPFILSANTTVRAMAVKTGLNNSLVAVSFLTISNPGKVQNPVITPGTGTYSGTQNVSISTATSGASIYFTTNGNLPNLTTPNSFTYLYSSPFNISATTTIRAIATKASLTNSDIVVATLTITNPTVPAATPVITPGTGTYIGPQTVNITSTTPGATLYFTTNGNNPLLTTPNSFTKLYTGPFLITGTSTIRAVATAPGFTTSAIALSVISIGGVRENVNDEVTNNSGLNIYPNPSDGLFYLGENGVDLDHAFLEIQNIEGKQIFFKELNKEDNDIQIDIRKQPAGLYILKIQNKEGIRTLRISKK
jgi:hypothetical protein